MIGFATLSRLAVVNTILSLFIIRASNCIALLSGKRVRTIFILVTHINAISNGSSKTNIREHSTALLDNPSLLIKVAQSTPLIQ